MKKLLIITLALSMLLSFAACGKGSNKVSAAMGANGGGKAEPFLTIFSSGTYHMKARTAGSGVETTMETYVQGELMATVMEAGGESSRMILRDNTAYIINDAEKTVMSIPSAGSNRPGEPVQASGMILTGSGTAEFNGKNLFYEEYADEDGNKAQYFLDGDNLAGIRNIIGEGIFDVIILALDQNIPANVFDIPSGYQQLGM
jgi:hypothetical protein